MKKMLAFWLVSLMVVGTAAALFSNVEAEPRDPRDLSDVNESYFDWGPVYEVDDVTVMGHRLLLDGDDVLLLWEEGSVNFALMSKVGDMITTGTLPSVEGQWDAAMDGDEVVVVWITENRLQIQRYDTYGNQLTMARTISVDGFGMSQPSVAVSDDGTTHITYIATKIGHPVVAYLALRSDGTTLISNKVIDVDGTDAIASQVTTSEKGAPFLLLSTQTGTYVSSVSSSGSLIWHSKVYSQGQGDDPGISIRNSVVVSSWTHGGKVNWAVHNEQGSMISSDGLDVPGMTGPVSASLDSNGILHALVETGSSLEHLGILPGEGLLFEQTVATGLSPGATPIVKADAHDALHLTFLDDGLFYCHAMTYSFTVVSTDLSELANLHPGDKGTGTMTLSNTGGLVDAIGFEATMTPTGSGWAAEVTEDEVYLTKEGTNTATVTMFTPETGGDGDTITLSLALWSLSMPSKVVDLDIPIVLNVDYGVSIDTDAEFMTVPPGFHEDMMITVTNDGEVVEDIYVNAEVQGSPGWGSSLSEDHVTLQPGASVHVPLTVTAPEAANEGQVAVIDITAMVMEDQSTASRLPVYAMALSDVDISLTKDRDGNTVLPGEATTYIMEVTNEGRSNGLVSVLLEVVSGVGDWDAYLATEVIELAGGASTIVPLTVVAPDDALEGSRFVVRVKATSQRMLDEEVVDVTTYVGKVSDIDVDLDKRYARTDPGDMAHYTFSVTNNGNGLEYISLRSETPFGWEPIRYSIDGVMVKTLPIDIGETIEIDADASVPTGTNTDDYDLKIRVINGEVDDLSIITHVNMVSDIWLSAAETVREAVDGEAGFNFRIKNYGNGPDVVQLIPEGLPDGWRYEFPDNPDGFLTMVQGKELSVSMNVFVPEDVHEEDIEFDLRALPLIGDGVIAKLLIKVLPPDLEITSIEFSTHTFVEGDVEAVSITVHNHGPGPAGRVVVKAEDNGRVFGSDEVLVIRPNSDVTVTFTWAVFEGRHNLRFTVDPEDRIYERNEDNNRQETRVTATPRSGPTPPMTSTVVVGTTLTITLSILCVGVASTEWGRFKLIWLFWVPLYTKLKRTGVLDHFLRGQVYGYIKANPGEHYNAIKKALSLKNGTLVYHLQTLEREEYVKSVSDGRYKRFYPAGMRIPDEPMRRLNKIQEIILKLIGEHPGITQKEIAEEIGLSGATINYHINVMLKAKVIRKDKVGRKTHMYVLEEEETPERSFSEVGPVGK